MERRVSDRQGAEYSIYRSRLIDADQSVGRGIFLTWLGTAGVLVDDGSTGILIDPFVSRQSLLRVVLGMRLPPDRGLIRHWADSLGCRDIKAVVVSHSHYDHVLDAPYFAMETGAPMAGSSSALNVGRGAGILEERLIEVRGGSQLRLGDFKVGFVESRHGPAFLGRVPWEGEIGRPVAPPASAGDYRCGAVFSLTLEHPWGTLVHHGSAGFAPGMYEGMHADLILLGISGRGDTQAYLSQVTDRIRPGTIIPIHFDDFFAPLADGMRIMRTARLGEFVSSAEGRHVHCAVRTAPIGSRVRVLPGMTAGPGSDPDARP